MSLSYYTNAHEINVIPANNIDGHILQRLKALFIESFSNAYKQIDIKDINSNFDSTSNYLDHLFDIDWKSVNNLNFDLIVTTENQEIIGYVLCCYCYENKKIYIHHLVVDMNKHRKGIGKILVNACENFYKDAHYISLSTRKFNLNAIGFYKYIGFYETDSVPEITYLIRPNAKNNPQIINLEKSLTKK